jgi:hypothetical protein
MNRSQLFEAWDRAGLPREVIAAVGDAEDPTDPG